MRIIIKERITQHGIRSRIKTRRKLTRMASKPVRISELDFENGNIAENWKRWKQTMRDENSNAAISFCIWDRTGEISITLGY